MDLNQIFIVGIHTDAGKTHFCALFAYAFNYTYHKLIQAGSPTDSNLMTSLYPNVRIIPPHITLKIPASPHIGRKIEHLNYNGLSFALPKENRLIIELAGGLYTPLDDRHTMLDYIRANPHPIILVGRYYVGCINHLLLSIESLGESEICAVVMMDSAESNLKTESSLANIDENTLIDDFIRAKLSQHTPHIPLIRAYFPTAKTLATCALAFKNAFYPLKAH